MTKTKKYRVDFELAIHVQTVLRQPGEEFDAVGDQELKNLVSRKYLSVVA